mmetsp:Transcript_15330/g.47466  ORF Transcript_15330/g.47466 Transcript_15330/m.47466 type:complete len:231 (+) Transcript_15330:762-1454(+)
MQHLIRLLPVVASDGNLRQATGGRKGVAGQRPRQRRGGPLQRRRGRRLACCLPLAAAVNGLGELDDDERRLVAWLRRWERLVVEVAHHVPSGGDVREGHRGDLVPPAGRRVARIAARVGRDFDGYRGDDGGEERVNTCDGDVERKVADEDGVRLDHGAVVVRLVHIEGIGPALAAVHRRDRRLSLGMPSEEDKAEAAARAGADVAHHGARHHGAEATEHGAQRGVVDVAG